MRCLTLLVALLLLGSCSSTEHAQQPVTNRNQMIAYMLRDPNLRAEGIRMLEADNAASAGYPGNCPTDFNYDAAGHLCGRRSAMSRPGGY